MVKREGTRVRFFRRIFALSTILLAMASPTAGYGAVWGVYGGGAAHLRSAAGYAPPGTLAWQRRVYGVVEFPPVYYRGSLYLAQDSGQLLSINATTGADQWRDYTGRVSESPVAYAGLIIFGHFNGSHTLEAVSATTGSTIWRRPWGGSEDSPIVVSGRWGPRLIVTNSEGTIASLNPFTGRAFWQRQIGAAGTYSGRYTGSPCYSSGHVYVANYAGDFWSFTLAGRVAWHRSYHESVYANLACPTGGYVYGVARNGWAFALSATTGAMIWNTRTGYLDYGAPAYADGSIFTTDYSGDFWRIDAATGAVQWHIHTATPSLSSPVVLGHEVYFATAGATPTTHGAIWGYRLADMRLVWYFQDGKYSPAEPVGNRILVCGFGTLYMFHQK